MVTLLLQITWLQTRVTGKKIVIQTNQRTDTNIDESLPIPQLACDALLPPTPQAATGPARAHLNVPSDKEAKGQAIHAAATTRANLPPTGRSEAGNSLKHFLPQLPAVDGMVHTWVGPS